MERFITQRGIPMALMLFIAISIAACKKQDPNFYISGKHIGKFIYWDSGITYNNGGAMSEITFTGNSYSITNLSTSPLGYSAPVTTTGTYVATVDSIKFTATGTNIPTGIFSLNGNYKYHYEHDSLIITRQYLQFSFNQYRLKRN